MEQNQMSKFCINLEGLMLPDAIAAVVEAWYDAQNAGNMAKQNHGPYRPGEPIDSGVFSDRGSGCTVKQPENIRRVVIQPWEKHQMEAANAF
jgi:hypothetical protein